MSTEISEFETASGDLFLLCSDGLTRELPDGRIETILNETDDLDSICKRLIDAANDAGGRDNVTCVVVRTV